MHYVKSICRDITQIAGVLKTNKMEDEVDGRRPRWKMTKMENEPDGRRTRWKTTQVEDDQNHYGLWDLRTLKTIKSGKLGLV